MVLKKIKQIISGIQKIKYNCFFGKKMEYATLEDIVFLTKSEIVEDYDTKKQIVGINTLKKAKENEVSFLTNSKYSEDLKVTKAGAVFINRKDLEKVPKNTLALIHENPHFAYMLCLEAMYTVPIYERHCGISRKAHIAWSAKIGRNVEIQDGVYIDKNVKIGNNCKICANAVIYHDCVIEDNTFIGANTTISYSKIGKNCIIHNNASIGKDGFGFVHHKMFNFKIPQIGKVIIGEACEIGAHTCIDRGALEDTIIGANCKIDNLIQIAHGVKIGIGTFIASGVGIAGSAEIGNFVQIGGKTAIAGHTKIADGVSIAAGSGVIKDIDLPKTSWGGAPALPVRKWHKLNILLNNMVNNKTEENKDE